MGAKPPTMPEGPFEPTWESLEQYQAPNWYQDGKFAGVVELSIPIPDKLPHFDRD